MKLSALIVDDEPKPAKFLFRLIENYCSEIKNVEIANSAHSAIHLINQNYYDLIFMDIEMPEMNGFDLLDSVSQENKPIIIFTTAHEKYAAKAFKVEAIDYLLKPIHPKELIQALQKVIVRLNEKRKFQSDQIHLFDGKQYHIIDLNELVRVEADGSYCYFILQNGTKFHSSKRLKTYEALLEENHFVRSHKSHMVNLKFIKSYTFSDGGLIYLANGDTTPFSASRKNDFLSRLKTIAQ